MMEVEQSSRENKYSVPWFTKWTHWIKENIAIEPAVLLFKASKSPNHSNFADLSNYPCIVFFLWA